MLRKIGVEKKDVKKLGNIIEIVNNKVKMEERKES